MIQADKLTTIAMSEFTLNWRLTDPKYDFLPENHLEKIHPLDERSANLHLAVNS